MKNILLRYHKGGEAETRHTCLGHQPLHKLCFYSSRIRTLVAMATYIFQRPVMGNLKHFFLSQCKYLEFIFIEMVIE